MIPGTARFAVRSAGEVYTVSVPAGAPAAVRTRTARP